MFTFISQRLFRYKLRSNETIYHMNTKFHRYLIISFLQKLEVGGRRLWVMLNKTLDIGWRILKNTAKHFFICIFALFLSPCVACKMYCFMIIHTQTYHYGIVCVCHRLLTLSRLMILYATNRLRLHLFNYDLWVLSLKTFILMKCA